MNLIKPSFSTGYAKNASESANPNLWKGLVGAWMPSFGVTGNTLKDVSGNGNDGVQVGAGAGWQASSLRNGSVNRYNAGGNQYMIAEDAASLQPTSLTASFWVNVFNLTNNESGFLDKQADPNASQSYLNTCFHGYVYAGYLLFRLASPSNANHVLIGDQSSYGGSNTLFSNFINQWLHVACTYDEKTGEANLYRDGQKVVTRTSSPSPLKTGTGDLLINGMYPVSRFALSGLMNSMLIHNRALSPTEIKQLYLNPAAPFQKKTTTVVSVPVAPPTTTAKAVVLKKPKPSYATGYARNASESANPNLWKGLVGAWMPSFGVTGGTLRDVSGNGNDGTLTNMDPATDWVGTSKGLALDFDGDDDYIELGSIAANNLLTLDGNRGGTIVCNALTRSGDSFQRLFDKSTAGTAINGYNLCLDNNYGLHGSINGRWAYTGKTYNYNQSYQFAWSFIGDDWKYYQDAEILPHTIFTGPLWSNVPQVTTNARIGSWNHSTGRELKGNVSSLLIYNRALSPTEIKQLYLNPSAPFERKQQTVGLSTAAAVPSANFNPFSVLTHPLEQ